MDCWDQKLRGGSGTGAVVLEAIKKYAGLLRVCRHKPDQPLPVLCHERQRTGSRERRKNTKDFLDPTRPSREANLVPVERHSRGVRLRSYSVISFKPTCRSRDARCARNAASFGSAFLPPSVRSFCSGPAKPAPKVVFWPASAKSSKSVCCGIRPIGVVVSAARRNFCAEGRCASARVTAACGHLESSKLIGRPSESERPGSRRRCGRARWPPTSAT